MKRQAQEPYQIIYHGLSANTKAFLRRRPGKQPYICFNKSGLLETEGMIDTLILLTEADRTLTPVERCADLVIFLRADCKLEKMSHRLSGYNAPLVDPPVYKGTFCPN